MTASRDEWPYFFYGEKKRNTVKYNYLNVASSNGNIDLQLTIFHTRVFENRVHQSIVMVNANIVMY